MVDCNKKSESSAATNRNKVSLLALQCRVIHRTDDIANTEKIRASYSLYFEKILTY